MIVKAPATSANLGPGFDSLGIALDIKNETFIKHSRFFSISIKGEGANQPSLKKNNAFVNIFYNAYTELTGKKDNFRFVFNNKIPLSRGMGSSSSVIVGAIFAAYEMAGVKISKEKILQKALVYESHPDNITPACVGGFTVSTLEKGEVFYLKKEVPKNIQALMVIPNRAMSTSISRTKLPRALKLETAVFNLSRSSLLTGAFFSENWDVLRVASQDKIHQTSRMKNLPELFEVQKKALEEGALMSTLSGSGSSFFNLVHKDDAQRLKIKLKEKFNEFEVEVFDFDNVGVVVDI